MVRSFSGLEVYETKNNPKINTSENSSDKLIALNGDVTEIAYYDNLYSTNHDEDYEGISNNGSVSFDEINLKRFYKGKKICLKKGKEKNNQIKWSDLESILLGFISEINFDTDGVDVKLVGMSKLLDQEKEFTFKKTKRSKILKKIIESAGLKADIDTTGLKDESVDYTNVSSSSGSSSYSAKGSEDAIKLAEEVCQGKTSDKEKAQAIHSSLCDIKYPSRNYTNHKKCPNKVLKDKISNCCDRARTGYVMAKSQNLTVRGCHGPKHVWIQYKIDGKWVDSDPASSRKELGSVWEGMSRQAGWDFPECE